MPPPNASSSPVTRVSPATICGVMKTTSSEVSLSWSRLRNKAAPISGTRPRYGICLSVSFFSSLRKPPMITVAPSRTMTFVSAVEVSTIGILLLLGVVSVRITLEISGLIFMVTNPSALIFGVTTSWIPTSMNWTSSAVVVVVWPVVVVVVM